MTVGQKIKKIRHLRNLSQKELAYMCELSEPAIRNYELGNRKPSQKHLKNIAMALDVDPMTLEPDIDVLDGVMHILFEIEDEYGIKIVYENGTLRLSFGDGRIPQHGLREMILEWTKMTNRFNNGEISKEEYDNWRYRYPRSELEEQRKSLNNKRNNSEKKNNDTED